LTIWRDIKVTSRKPPKNSRARLIQDTISHMQAFRTTLVITQTNLRYKKQKLCQMAKIILGIQIKGNPIFKKVFQTFSRLKLGKNMKHWQKVSLWTLNWHFVRLNTLIPKRNVASQIKPSKGTWIWIVTRIWCAVKVFQIVYTFAQKVQKISIIYKMIKSKF